MPLYLVKASGGVGNMPSNPMEDGDFEIAVTAKVCVEAPDEVGARARALDVLENEEAPLSLPDGEVVEFEIDSVELSPASVKP